MRTISWSKFQTYDVKDSDLDEAQARPFPHVPGARYKAVDGGIEEPARQIIFEDFFPGPDYPTLLAKSVAARART